MTELRVLSSGIDTLYVSVKGKLWDGLLSVFGNMRELNPDKGVVFEFRANDRSFVLRPHGAYGFRYWLANPSFEVFFGRAEPMPPLYMQLHSAFLHTIGPEAAIAEVEQFLRADFFPSGCALTASRVDVCADVQGWVPVHADFHRFTCRGVRRKAYEEPQPQQLHGFGRRLSGFTFGKGDVVARIYDKTLEIASRGETWPTTLWPDRDLEEPVWRIEFQFRRAALQQLRLHGVDQAVTLRQGLWEYGMQWLSLREPSDHARPARWPEDPLWTALRSTQVGAPTSPLIREHIRVADERRIISGLVGYASSLAAMTGDRDVDEALDSATPRARRYLRERGVEFADVADRKRNLRKALRGDQRAPGDEIAS